MTTDYRSKDIDRLGVEAVETAIRNGQSPTPVAVSLEPKNLQQVINRTDAYGGKFSAGTEAQIISEAGLVQLFTIQTGLSSFVPKNLLVAKLREVNEHGMPVWTSRQNEAAVPIEPTYLCLLHKEHPLRSRADELGFIVCGKKMTNPKDVIDHSKKHSRAWESFEQDKADAKAARTEEWQKESMAAITSRAIEQPVSGQPQMLEKVCGECGDSFFATNLESVDIKLMVHLRQHGVLIVPTGVEINSNLDVDEPITNLGTIEDISIYDRELSTDEIVQPKPDHWMDCPTCDFVADGRSKAGSASKMRSHKKWEHDDGR